MATRAPAARLRRRSSGGTATWPSPCCRRAPPSAGSWPRWTWPRASTATSRGPSPRSPSCRRAPPTPSWPAASARPAPCSRPHFAPRAGRAERVDAAEIVVTDGRHGAATPDLVATRRNARRRLLSLLRRGVTPVVPGFYGSAPDGSLATLGRGGTDLTATLLGRSLGASRVVLWKDVPGILTADPKSVPDARLVPQLHHREAAEVAYFGAKVLHPRALIPLEGSRIPLIVRSFVEPTRPGTEVSSRRTLAGYPVKALATVKGQALVTVAGKGMVGVPGIAARTFEAVHVEGLSVSTIFQASSESSIGFTLPESEAARAVAALKKAFREELGAGLVDGVTARAGMSVVAVVGNGMAGAPGIAARVFSALAAGGVNVVAIAQGSSELNISFVVATSDAPEAARRVHAAFQLSKIGGGRSPGAARTDVVLLGFGRVGRALADQLAAHNGSTPVRLVGLLDRSGYVFEPEGVSRAPAAAAGPGQGPGLDARGARRRARFGGFGPHLHRRPRGLAPGGRGRDRRGDGRPPARRPRPRLRPRAREQEAARRLRRKLPSPARCGAGARPSHPLRGDGGGRAADHRHLPEARGEWRPRAQRRRLRERDPWVRALRGVGRAPVLGRGARGRVARLRRARSPRRSLGPRCGAQGPHPRRASSATRDYRPRRKT